MPKLPPLLARPLERLRSGLRAWRQRRRWTPERQLAHLRTMLLADHRWLASDRVASALTARYLAALAPDWFRTQHEDVARLRSRLGLVPPGGWDPDPSAAAHPTRHQAGMTNAELRVAWNQKLPGVTPSDRELTAFALGAEVGLARGAAAGLDPTLSAALRAASDRCSGLSLDYRRAGTGWPEQWRARLFNNKNERYDWRVERFAATPEDALSAAELAARRTADRATTPTVVA